MEESSKIAPMQMESSVGQFLSRILVSHPHLLPAAVDQQLQTHRIAEQNKEEYPAPSGTDIVLYRRIVEVKANERRRAHWSFKSFWKPTFPWFLLYLNRLTLPVGLIGGHRRMKSSKSCILKRLMK